MKPIFNEKEFKKALELRDKNVIIDFVCQYKWERDYFESQNKLHQKAFDLAIHNLACLYNELLKKGTPTKEEVEAMENLILATARKVIDEEEC